MKKKLALFLLFFTLFFISFKGDVFSYNKMYSNYLNNSIELNRSISSNSLIPISDYSKYSGDNYTFLSGLSMLGIETYERSVKDILSDYRNFTGVSNSDYSNIYPQDIISLDMILSNQEQLDVSMNNFYKNKFVDLNIAYINSSLNVHFANQAYLLLSYLPSEHLNNISDLEIHNRKDGLNGYTTDSHVEIRSSYLMDDSKFRALLTHELAHTYDNSYAGNANSGLSAFTDFEKPIFNDDYIVQFYQMSWMNNYTRNKNSSTFDFVSQYAMTDPFEDFAETYSLYVNQGNYFRCIAARSSVLQEKYNFMKYIFRDYEYNTGREFCDSKVVYDVTDL